MWSVIGIYTGCEDNIFWERQHGRIAATRAAAIEQLTGAIHIDGGDFFATPRSEWDRPDSLEERAWRIERAVHVFAQSNERFLAWQNPGACR